MASKPSFSYGDVERRAFEARIAEELNEREQYMRQMYERGRAEGYSYGNTAMTSNTITAGGSMYVSSQQYLQPAMQYVSTSSATSSPAVPSKPSALQKLDKKISEMTSKARLQLQSI